MLRVGSWLYGKKPGANGSTQSLDSLSEVQDLEDAMGAATLILNDDVDGAEAGLDKGNSSFHKLGKGVVAFVRATLGFEQEIMRQASERLGDAETGSASDQHRAQHNANAPNAYRSQIYSPGTEFALVQAMAQLMGAVVAVLNESLTESIKGFYKMRKAYLTLDGILKMEEKFIQEHQSRISSLAESQKSSNQATLPGQGESAKASSTSTETPFTDAKSQVSSTASSTADPKDKDTGVNGEPIKSAELSEKLSKIAVSDERSDNPPSTGASTPSPATMLDHDPGSEIFSNPVDAYVHSGSNFCFGVLLLLISMVPPAFSKLLSIIGFHGDKQKGLRMLWQASKFHNLMGAIAALTLLAYYNGFVRYCDIMPDATSGEDKDIEGYPQERLAALLSEMRKRYPNSQLWLLEESRMNGANKNLRAALELLCGDEKSGLKQVEALRVFERSLNAMYLHEYRLCSKSFLECVELNSWSRSLYYYIAGSCHVTLYRQNAESDPSSAAEHAKKATEYFELVPTVAGKKRFMARQLPFDVFVTRKIAKWEARAKAWNVPLVDAVGVDPVEEMIFFWNGHSRMTKEQLEESLSKLAWSESDANKNWSREDLEEKAILNLLRAAVYRSMGRHHEAKKILRTQILNQDKNQFKGHLKDDWICPVANFEMAANLWMERPTYIATHGSPQSPGSTEDTPITDEETGSDETIERKKVHECKQYLERAARWESYELDARIGLKVTAALEAVQKWENAHPASS